MASAKDVMLSMDSDAEGKHCAWSMDKNLMKDVILSSDAEGKHCAWSMDKNLIKFYISIASTAKRSTDTLLCLLDRKVCYTGTAWPLKLQVIWTCGSKP